jgi:glycolate oxidase
MQQITTEILAQIKSIVGAEYVFTDEESFEKYGRDETEKLHYSPAVVVKPRTPQEIAALMQLANKHLIPVTPRGAGTGLTGGALPHLGGLVIAMERFNSILDIDERNLQVTTEPGVITEVLQNAVKEKGLFYPPDPASKGSCFIGGNISENSGGPKAVKYGVVKDYVLNLEIVLPTGEIIWTGSNVLKNATGYNLTQLIVGSEGTLGIVTKIVLRLIPHPKFDLLMLAPFDSLEKASEAVSAIFRAGITPSAMELMEIESIKLASKLCESTAITITDNLAAHLIIEVDGNDKDVLMKDYKMIDKNETIEKAIQMLLNGQSKNFLITENNQPIGTLSRDEIIKALSEKGQIEIIENVMNRKLIFINANTPLEAVYQQALENHANLLLVMENNQLIGTLDTENILEFIMVKDAHGK